MGILRIQLMATVLILFVHVITCGWYWLGRTQDDGWTSTEIYQHVSSLPADASKFDNLSFWYITSMRWVIAQLNGRTDMTDDRNATERALTCTLGIFLAVVVRTCFTSLTTKTVLELGDLVKEKTRLTRIVNTYFDVNKVPAELQITIKRYLKDYFDTSKQSTNERDVLSILPVNVAYELLFEVRAPFVLQHSLFEIIAVRSCAAFRHICFNAIELSVVANDDVVFNKGDHVEAMRLIHKGKFVYGRPVEDTFHIEVQFPDPDDPERVPRLIRNAVGQSPAIAHSLRTELSRGNCVSEAALWLHWISQGTLQSVGISEVYEIKSFGLAMELNKYPEAYARAVLYGRKFLSQLCFQELNDYQTFVIRECPPMEALITIRGAGGLAEIDTVVFGVRKPDPYCVARVAGLQCQSHFSAFQTKVIHNTYNPEWNYQDKIQMCPGEDIEFVLWDDYDNPLPPQYLGTCRLPCEKFMKTGHFHGSVSVSGGNAPATLHVSVSVKHVNELSKEEFHVR